MEIVNFKRKENEINQMCKVVLEQTEVTQRIKTALISRPLLTIFDLDLSTELHTDVSAVGLGGILIQKKDNES